MRICLIAEGCYPYIPGGVSAWIQMLIKGMPEHEFIIYTIGAEEKLRGLFKYEVPKNVIEVREHFLDEFFHNKIKKKRKFKLTKDQNLSITNLINGEQVNWDVIFDMFSDKSDMSGNDFLVSKAFLDIIMDSCRDKYRQVSFNEVFWTIRSMLVPILNLIKSDVPVADIYHSVSTGYAGIMGAKFKYETGKPYIVTEHGIYTREREEEILKANWIKGYFKKTWIGFFNSLSLGSYKSGDYITSLFHVAKSTQIELGADRNKCMVIPNGISLEQFSGVTKIKEEVEEVIIGAIVRVVPIKDIKTMIYSFDLVRKEIPKVKLYIIGPYEESPEYYDECIELIESLRCSGIEFTGRVDIKEWMGKLDIVLLTSVSEGQPFVLLESMASKRPFIATDVGSCREIAEGPEDEFGNAGFITPVMDPNLIARAVVRLCKDRNLMIQMGENGYNRVKKFYQKEDFLQKYEELYRSVSLNGRGGL